MPKKQAGRRDSEGSPDSLGKLIKTYRPIAAKGLGAGVILFLTGIAVLIYCQLHQPYPFKVMLAGIFLLVMGPVLVTINALHVGSSLEVRREGVRFRDHSGTTEVAWDDIVDVEVKRTDVTSLGIGTMFTKRSDLRLGGPLTARTEWEIVLQTREGSAMRLSPGFLQHVPDVRSLIVLLQKNAGLR